MHHHFQSHSNNANDGSPMSSSDVETFNGKIVYNLDGSAFIIDAGNATTAPPAPPGDHLTTSGARTTSASPCDKLKGETVFLKSGLRNKQRSNKESDEGSGEEGVGFGEGAYQLSPKIHSFRVVSAQDACNQIQFQQQQQKTTTSSTKTATT
ncbi:zinc finger protein 2-like, partial [Drosophila grimshawi]|uniref:zinc finger protein 2-like n=1 Tax=Drosophila grimshawi TaxID=7222 RepID=UPI001C93476D